jgi:hypothetical protein
MPLTHSAPSWQGTPAARGGRGAPGAAAQVLSPLVQIASGPQTAGSAAHDWRQVPSVDAGSGNVQTLWSPHGDTSLSLQPRTHAPASHQQVSPGQHGSPTGNTQCVLPSNSKVPPTSTASQRTDLHSSGSAQGWPCSFFGAHVSVDRSQACVARSHTGHWLHGGVASSSQRWIVPSTQANSGPTGPVQAAVLHHVWRHTAAEPSSGAGQSVLARQLKVHLKSSAADGPTIWQVLPVHVPGPTHAS